MTPAAAPEILVFAEAQDLLRCSASTLLDCIHDGSVPAFKLGRGWRFYRSELTALRWVREDEPMPDVRPMSSRR